jgi:hypothetical protein
MKSMQSWMIPTFLCYILPLQPTFLIIILLTIIPIIINLYFPALPLILSKQLNIIVDLLYDTLVMVDAFSPNLLLLNAPYVHIDKDIRGHVMQHNALYGAENRHFTWQQDSPTVSTHPPLGIRLPATAICAIMSHVQPDSTTSSSLPLLDTTPLEDPSSSQPDDSQIHEVVNTESLVFMLSLKQSLVMHLVYLTSMKILLWTNQFLIQLNIYLTAAD